MLEFLYFIGGALLSWMIAALFYRRSTEDLRAEQERLSTELKRRDTVEYFELMTVRGTWSLHSIGGRDTWICNERGVFSIQRNDDYEDFEEEWTTKPPDKRASRSTVDLKINGAAVRSLDFISLDGGRYFLPMPKKRGLKGSVLYFWECDSIEFKVGKIVGSYYRFDNIEDAALFLGVEIVSSHQH